MLIYVCLLFSPTLYVCPLCAWHSLDNQTAGVLVYFPAHCVGATNISPHLLHSAKDYLLTYLLIIICPTAMKIYRRQWPMRSRSASQKDCWLALVEFGGDMWSSVLVKLWVAFVHFHCEHTSVCWQVEATASCTKAVTKMLQCPLCHALDSIRPCNDYCMNVMRGCLVHHAGINDAWNTFIGQ